jgi:RNA recognition motif-containing protein
VGNLGFEAKEEDVEQLFSGMSIKSIKFVRDRETQKFKGFSYVEFETVDELERAVKMSGEVCRIFIIFSVFF